MEIRKTIDTGGLSFRDMREEDMYYVDKSLLIKDILDSNRRGVYLYTRPRRFGKTTNITMLDAFFNQEYKGNNWFDGLAISEYPEYEQYKNAFPVISLDMKDLMDDSKMTYDQFIDKFRIEIKEAVSRFDYLLESDKISTFQKNDLMSILNNTATDGDLQASLKVLCRMLSTHHGRNVIVLIDEYDNAALNVVDVELRSRIVGFIGGFLSSTLKGNQNLQMAYVTGVMQITKSNMFSGLNNIRVNSIFSKESDERFGFTEQEVKDLLGYYGHPEKFDEAKEWYDGYRFGDAEVYNPFSLMNYVSSGFVTENYWYDVSHSTPIRSMLMRSNLSEIDRVTRIMDGEAVDLRLNRTMTFEEMGSDRFVDLCSLMAMSGYLKAVPTGDGRYSVSIPNNEVLSSTRGMIQTIVAIDDTTFVEFNRAVLDGNVKVMESTLSRILSGSSYYSLASEFSYENILLTMLCGISRHYDVKAEREYGNGRTDLMFTPKSDGAVPMIMELKRSTSEESLGSDAIDAIKQIHEKRYYLGMDKAILIGLAFFGKIPKCVIEVYDP